MPKSSKLTSNIGLGGLSIKDPRIAMRAAIGTLLVANLVVAVIAFKPFGGSADDLRKDQARLSSELRKAQTRLEGTKIHVAKIKIAQEQGTQFLAKYIMDDRGFAASVLSEFPKAAADAGVRFLPETNGQEPIEGSDTLMMETITAGFEGSYAGLTKLVNTLEKSPHFVIIDSMNLNAPQQQQNAQHAAGGGQVVNITMKLLMFVHHTEAEALP